MSDVIKSDPSSINDPGDSYVNTVDADPAETQEWLESLQYVLGSKGPERVKFLLSVLEAKALVDGVDMPAKSKHGLHQHDFKRKHAAVPRER